VFGFVVWYEKAFTNLITDEMTSFPKFKFFVMGVFGMVQNFLFKFFVFSSIQSRHFVSDALSGVLALFGGVYTSGNTQGLLNQGAVPITMILSYVVLKQRYSRLQVIGALVIMGGVITVLLPKFLDNNAPSGEDRPLFNIIFLLSVIPMALSSIYKVCVL
jgi:drug/metabolite transporter (DMT)-like permease